MPIKVICKCIRVPIWGMGRHHTHMCRGKDDDDNDYDDESDDEEEEEEEKEEGGEDRDDEIGECDNH